jgi:hypothetical protein
MTQLVVWLNAIAGACASVLLAPIAALPGWLSATLVAAITGVVMLFVFKYTSNQRAIKHVRAGIKANLLALSLFKDSPLVSLKSQGRILLGVVYVLLLSLIPTAVMLVPVCLALGQLALWYQARPLRVGEEAVITVKTAGARGDALPQVNLATGPEFEVTVGPVHVPIKNLICWSVQARQPGSHRLAFDIGKERFQKELVVGEGFMPVSSERPAWSWEQALLNPREPPFPADSPIESIAIDYQSRSGWTCGTNTWVFYWFLASMVAAFAVKPILKVNL